MKITNGNSGHLGNSHFGFKSTAHQSPQKLNQRPPLQHQLSPLQKLQADYREKLQHEKEKKMTLLYQKWREESLRNIAKKSSKVVKQHFKVDDSDKYSNRLPQKLAQPTVERKENYRINSAHNPHEQRRPGHLPPIYQNNEIAKSKSFYNRSYRNERNDIQGKDGRTFRPSMTYQQASSSNQIEDAGDSPPDSRQLRQLCQRKLQQRKKKMLGEVKEQEFVNMHNGNRENQRELSDFEQWQLEQDAAKTARLRKFNEQQHQLKMNGHGSSSRDPPTQEINLDLKVDYCGEKKHKLMAANKIRENIQKQSRNVNGGPNLKRNQMSSSPTITQNRKDSPKRQEALRQKLKEKEIYKLQEELRRKQEELRRMQFNRESSTSFSGSDYDSDHDKSHVQKGDKANLSKVNGAKRRFESGHKEISVSLFSDDEEDSASVGFQMKPVLVRRNGSGNSSKGNIPHATNTNSNHSPAVKNNGKRVKKQTTSVTSDDMPLPTSLNKRSLNYPVNDSSQTNGQIVTDDGETLELVPCKTCGRKFREDRLSKHAKICMKNVKKRKVYDMSKARTKGTDFEKFVRDNKVMRKPTPVSI